MVNSPSCAKPSKLDSSIAEKPQIEVSTPSRSVGQMRARVALDRAVRGGLGKQIDRIVDRLADQRGAEAERYAVHCAEQQPDGGDAGERAADRPGTNARNSTRTER